MTYDIGYERPSLLAELQDLLQLDHDAVAVYSLAIHTLDSRVYREALLEYRGDHERHIEDLERLISQRGGSVSVLPHIPTGFFKLATQAMGIAGGDRGIFLAFRANERQVRNKYGRHAARAHPLEVAELLRRNADDEEKHFAWVSAALTELGLGPRSMIGGAADLFGMVHGANADMTEAVQRAGLSMIIGRRRNSTRSYRSDARE